MALASGHKGLVLDLVDTFTEKPFALKSENEILKNRVQELEKQVETFRDNIDDVLADKMLISL